MKRRKYIKTIALGSILPFTDSSFGFVNKAGQFFSGPKAVDFKSNWKNWPDMRWAGPEYWGNRLQDWEVQDGKLRCDITGFNRTLQLLTVQNVDARTAMELSATIHKINNGIDAYETGCVGLLVGAKGDFDDYRSAAVFGKGIQIGLTPKGKFQVGDEMFDTGLESIPETFKLVFKNEVNNGQAIASVKVSNPKSNEIFFEKNSISIEGVDCKGNFALLCSFGENQKTDRDQPSIVFDDWQISSPSLYVNENNIFGPICFAQYTLNKKKLKLTAQLAPIEMIKDHKVLLAFKKDGKWVVQEETQVKTPGRAINFQIKDWDESKETPYRVSAHIPVGDAINNYVYEGTISAEPLDKEQLDVAVFSCNAHYGFPDQDIPDSLEKLNYDLCLFLGDQFYEGTGGYGAMREGEFDKLCLDYLRKWMMFGWGYREIFRHKPCAIIPDDHDVYHGNVWGEGGKKANVKLGYGSEAQDTGGYKMTPEWVNMVQFTQTSHLPDAFDPTPVKNNIGVYYTHWNYGGVSFAIIEDRKFKSAPKNVLPKEADVFNGFIRNTEFDIKKHKDLDAELLGERQERFLEEWVQDWSEGAQMKVLCSQTNFATVATLPRGSTSDSIVPSLNIPEKGEYIKGDAPTVDMDSNGWPSKKRNKAVEIIRKGFVFHIAGDQHLGSFIQYGIKEHGDAGFAFAGPALNNLWPRRFWPEVDSSAHTFNDPAYTGDFEDGFGNKISVMAVANPHNLHQEPEILYNRANGFGIVNIDKKAREIKTSCYQRFKDVHAEDAQYPGWPITVTQEDHLLKNAVFYLPKLVFPNSKTLPIIRVYKNDSLMYTLRVPSTEYRPKTRKKGKFRVLVVSNADETDLGILKSKEENKQKKTIHV